MKVKMIAAQRLAVLMTLLAALLAAPGSASAQELAPEHLAVARKYVELTDTSSVYEVALVQVGVDTMRTLLSQNPDMYDAVDAAIVSVLDSYKARKSELMDQFARVYAQRLTIEELQQIVDFYSTPTGQKLAELTPDANNDLQTILTLFQINLRTEFFAQVRSELKAAGHEL